MNDGDGSENVTFEWISFFFQILSRLFQLPFIYLFATQLHYLKMPKEKKKKM